MQTQRQVAILKAVSAHPLKGAYGKFRKIWAQILGERCFLKSLSGHKPFLLRGDGRKNGIDTFFSSYFSQVRKLLSVAKPLGSGAYLDYAPCVKLPTKPAREDSCMCARTCRSSRRPALARSRHISWRLATGELSTIPLISDAVSSPVIGTCLLIRLPRVLPRGNRMSGEVALRDPYQLRADLLN